MPIGDPKPQTVANQKYEKKIGLISKSYKLKKELTEEYAKACDKAGVSQAAKLTELMNNFINEIKERHSD